MYYLDKIKRIINIMIKVFRKFINNNKKIKIVNIFILIIFD